MFALPNIGGALCSTPQSLADAHYYTVSQKNVPLPPLQLVIIFTYTVRLRQFLAQMLPRKYAIKVYFIFPPRLTSAYALPWETGNPENATFHLNAACFFIKKTRNPV